MAKNVFVGVNNVARKVKAIYVGVIVPASLCCRSATFLQGFPVSPPSSYPDVTDCIHLCPALRRRLLELRHIPQPDEGSTPSFEEISFQNIRTPSHQPKTHCSPAGERVPLSFKGARALLLHLGAKLG